MITTLYINRSILMCQNEREPECLAVLLEWMCRCADDTRRLWKTTEYCGRARECRKEV